MSRAINDEIAAIDVQLAALESLHGILDNAALDAGRARLESQRNALVATLQGSGAVAQDRSIALGAGATLTVNVGAEPRNDEEALTLYRRWLISRCTNLPRLHAEQSDPSSAQGALALERLYVALNTSTMAFVVEDGEALRDWVEDGAREIRAFRKKEQRPLSALEGALQNPRLVLLGDPGSGKSTFINHLALCLASGRVEQLGDWQGEEARLPVLVLLRDFSRWLAAQEEAEERIGPRPLWRYIESQLKQQNLTKAADPIHEMLEAGEVLLLLDGLDEIPQKAVREGVSKVLAAFIERYPTARYIVTCRTLSYQEKAWQLPSVPSLTLAPFSEEQIDAFVGAWYADLAAQGKVQASEADGLARQLRRAVRRPDLWRLAPNPLLLTVMAWVHTHNRVLPDGRAELYKEAVDLLLLRWERVKFGATDEDVPLRHLLNHVGRADVDLKKALWELAFEAHKEGGVPDDDEAVADIGEWRLLKRLARLHPEGSTDWARNVVAVIRQRAGLLVERDDEIYSFPHRTFQEYMAGCHIATQGDFALDAAKLADDAALWREPILLAVGRLVHLGNTGQVLTLVGELCPSDADNTDVAWRKAWLAGEVLLEMGLARVRESNTGHELLARTQQRLVALLSGSQLTAVERAAAGNVLAALGDPRFDAECWQLPNEPHLGFVEIPAGSFTMGSVDDSLAFFAASEVPQHQLRLDRYWIARHPVTVAQWRAFVAESGHTPEDRDSLDGVATHPVVWVSWREAMRYCEWLTAQLQEEAQRRIERGTAVGEEFWAGLAAGSLHVTLPSEAEWEKAARGADKALIYPWGKNADPERANYSDTKIRLTSAVGCFTNGRSPYGIEEMSGNVWEWTRTLHGFEYKYNPSDGRESLAQSTLHKARVLRGGSFGQRRAGRALCRPRRGRSGLPRRLRRISDFGVPTPLTLCQQGGCRTDQPC